MARQQTVLEGYKDEIEEQKKRAYTAGIEMMKESNARSKQIGKSRKARQEVEDREGAWTCAMMTNNIQDALVWAALEAYSDLGYEMAGLEQKKNYKS